MISFYDARKLILEHVSPAGIEQVPVSEAAGRVLAENITAQWDIPSWDNSAMDGYAVRSSDCLSPCTSLKVTGYIAAGATSEGISLKSGCAVKIMTGAPVPSGADAVVPFEETQETPGEEITLRKSVSAGQHIRKKGEDIRSGALAIAPGTELRPPEIGMMASLGKALVTVCRKPQVAILSTGDELVEIGRPPAPGQIINSNSLAIAAAVAEAGAIPRIIGIARDTRDDHMIKIADGLSSDVLITSAGVSAGDRDLVRMALEELGAKILFWKIGIKPGKPTAFAVKNGTPVFALPGNPVSTLITFEELVRPALLKMSGHSRVIRPVFRAVLAEDIKHRTSDRLTFLRVRLKMENGRYVASSAGSQQTGILNSMISANAIAVVPQGRERLAAGEEIDVHFFGNHIEMQEI